MEEILSRQAATVYRVALSHTGQRTEAEDVMQDVFVAYIKSAPDFRDEEHEKAWFIRVTLNLCASWYRSGWRRHRAEELPQAASGEPIDRDLHLALLSLPDAERGILLLHYYEGYTTAEIAELMNLSVAAVKKRLERCRKKLKHWLGGSDDAYGQQAQGLL